MHTPAMRQLKMGESASEDRRGRGRPREFDRDKALDSALRLFWARGYAAVSIMDLCSAMDISPPSLYAAFGNKAGLFLEAARHYERIFWLEPARRLMEEPDIYAAIANYFQEAADILIAPDAPCGRMTALWEGVSGDDASEINAELGKIREATRQMFSERMRLAIQASQIPAQTDVPALAGCLAALLDGLALRARENVFLSQLKSMAAFAPRLLPIPARNATCPDRAPAGPERRRALLAPF